LVVLESPGDEEVVAFFDMHRANVVRVAVDEHGLCTDQLPEENASLVYVTPARHNPLGGILPLPRREALIKWARGAGAYIIEDDSDSEFRYHGTTPLPLAALDPYGLVFHTGSFGKTLGTGLDLGYLIVPSEFADAIVGLKSLADANCSWLEQMVVADLLISGEYHHHLRRVNKKYHERRDCLVEALSDYFGDVRLMGADAGTQLTWLLPEGLPAAEIVRETASAHGITLGSVSDQRLAAGLAARYCERALILGFASLACDGLRRGVACLAGALGGL
jgi:GntR family transcriptional regulator / MocR family aminotransferase